MIIDIGEELSKSLNTIIKNRKIETIKEVCKAGWRVSQGVDIPDFQKGKKETFEYHFYNVYLPRIMCNGKFHEVYNWALGVWLEMRLNNSIYP